MIRALITWSLPQRTRPWLVLVGCFVLSAGVNAFVIAPSSIAPLFMERFDISKTAAGNIISAAIVGAIISQIPGGYLLDRYDNRILIVAAVGVYVIGVITIQAVETFSVFLVIRVLGGMMAGFVFTAGANVVGEVFALSKQDFATGIYITNAPTSFALAHATGPLLGTRYGPLAVFLFHAAVAVLGLAIFWVAVTDPIWTGDTPTLGEFLGAIGNRALILVALSSFAMYSLYIFLNTWIPTYGSEVLRLSLSEAGIVTAIVPLVGIAARPVGGWLSGFLGGRRRLVVGGGLFGALVFLVVLPFAAALVVFLAVGAAAFTLQLGVGLYYVLTRQLAAKGTEGTSLTLLTAIGFTGSFVAPIAGGWLIEAYSWTVAFITFAAVGGLGIVVLVPVADA
jgi:predicted MFS family arabinose efflux permease